MSRLHIFQKVANVVVYLFFLGATVYSVAGPKPDPKIILQYETYITPAAWVFYIWSLIHLLLGGFVIYQWFEPAHEVAVHGVGWHFVISTVLNAVWLSLWHKGHLVLALIAILFTASSISFVFYNLEKNYPSSNWWDRILVHAPFSLWHGLIIFIATLNAFAAFTSTQEHGPDTLHITLAIFGLVFLTSTAIGYVEYKGAKGDITGALVIAIGLFAVFDHQTNPVIHWSALAAGIITALYPARPYIFRLLGRSSDSGENAPLLG
ncbi:hypothetical protein NQZ79_g2889 [Umbelopsis isabellina]|nr:hypothetical protein NQZ79_g2889 [Umbelopsis isabellina]